MEKPIISSMPDDIVKQTDPWSSTSAVKWKEPTASNNSRRVKLLSSHSPGDSFSIGDTIVKYTAVDASNTAVAFFKITVKGEGIFKAVPFMRIYSISLNEKLNYDLKT